MNRIVDLSLPIDETMPGVEVLPARHRCADGWNATSLTLYSHSGTHMDAPRHFFDEGAGIDALSLDNLMGPARVVDLIPVEPRQLLNIGDISSRIGEPAPRTRLLLRTDWHHRYGSAEYRDALPRISRDLATWLVEKKVALLGVEPPSVADVHNLDELTEVHEILLGGGVVIVEGLANLDQLIQAEVFFVALPLRIRNGDGCPVRAIAIEASEATYGP
ncbi:cyclase family protein [Bythopirellula polymerisocia]|nr:cyclase family protein [Bythopirellula polymerisocia]